MARKTQELVYIGIKGNVVALDRGTGREVWQTKLKGANFVNVTVERGQLSDWIRSGPVLLIDTENRQMLITPSNGESPVRPVISPFRVCTDGTIVLHQSATWVSTLMTLMLNSTRRVLPRQATLFPKFDKDIGDESLRQRMRTVKRELGASADYFLARLLRGSGHQKRLVKSANYIVVSTSILKTVLAEQDRRK